MPNHRPLAETLRPKSLDDFFGKSHLLNTHFAKRLIANDCNQWFYGDHQVREKPR